MSRSPVSRRLSMPKLSCRAHSRAFALSNDEDLTQSVSNRSIKLARQAADVLPRRGLRNRRPRVYSRSAALSSTCSWNIVGPGDVADERIRYLTRKTIDRHLRRSWAALRYVAGPVLAQTVEEQQTTDDCRRRGHHGGTARRGQPPRRGLLARSWLARSSHRFERRCGRSRRRSRGLRRAEVRALTSPPRRDSQPAGATLRHGPSKSVIPSIWATRLIATAEDSPIPGFVRPALGRATAVRDRPETSQCGRSLLGPSFPRRRRCEL